MKNFLIILIMFGTLSCRNRSGESRPEINDLEQMTPIFKLVEVDGKEYISIEESVCLSRIFRHSKGYVGPIKGRIQLNILECHKMIGYAPDEYKVLVTWLENFRHWLLGF